MAHLGAYVSCVQYCVHHRNDQRYSEKRISGAHDLKTEGHDPS